MWKVLSSLWHKPQKQKVRGEFLPIIKAVTGFPSGDGTNHYVFRLDIEQGVAKCYDCGDLFAAKWDWANLNYRLRQLPCPHFNFVSPPLQEGIECEAWLVYSRNDKINAIPPSPPIPNESDNPVRR